MENTKVKISKVLKELGVSPSLNGFGYLREAIALVLTDDSLLNRVITKQLYPNIAKKFNTTPSRVERGMRHAIERGFDKGNSELMEQIFGYTVSSCSGRATNKEFIACVVDYFQCQE